MAFTITPNTSVASVAQHIIDNHSRQQASTLLADMYDKQMRYMMDAIAHTDHKETIKYARNLHDITVLAKAHNIHRDMHSERLRTMPYRN